MPRTSTTPPANSPDPRGGFSLLEMLFVLALMSLTLLIVAPRGAVLTDRVMAHAAFFDFQRQVADLRREAYRSETGLVLYSPSQEALTDPQARIIALQTGWSYRLDRPVAITAGGMCSPAKAEILHGTHTVMQLVGASADCKFTRIG